MRTQRDLQVKNSARGQQQVWLPGLQVWAALGSRGRESSELHTTPGVAPPSCAHNSIGPESNMLRAKAAVSSPAEFPLKAAALATSATAQAETASDDNLPNCPICECTILSPA